MAEARLETYLSDPGRYDELLDPTGAVRAHWQPLIERLKADGAEGMSRGMELTRRLIVEDLQRKDRLWEC